MPLSRIRIEVDREGSANSCVEALDKYEQIIQVIECRRLGIKDYSGDRPEYPNRWPEDAITLDFYNDKLGREVHDEVIERTETGYKGRRVVSFDPIEGDVGAEDEDNGDPSIPPEFDRDDWVDNANSSSSRPGNPRKVMGWEWNHDLGEWDILAEYPPISGEWGTGTRGRWPESSLIKVDPPRGIDS